MHKNYANTSERNQNKLKMKQIKLKHHDGDAIIQFYFKYNFLCKCMYLYYVLFFSYTLNTKTSKLSFAPSILGFFFEVSLSTTNHKSGGLN